MKPRVAIATYALLALVVVPIFPHFVSPNEFTRWFLAKAIVENHTLEVTRQISPLLSGFEDISMRDGHLYSNKAPGGALVGLPAFAIAHAFTRNIRVTLTAMRLLAATLPALLLALVLMRAASRLGASDDRITIAVVVLLFATPLFAYGLLNFSHALAACCLFTAWWLLFVEKRADFAAGACIGLAVLAEYPCAIPAAVLVACAIPRWRTIAGVIAGGLPFAVVLGAYNVLTFGSPFTLSSGHERSEAFRVLASSGLFGIGVPNPLTFLRLLFDPSKGLFVFSPVLLLAVIAVSRAWQRLERAQFLAFTLAPLSLLILYSGYPNWHGGWTVGARYLVPAIPFIVLMLTVAEERPRLESAFIGWSAVAVITTSLVFPFVPEDVPFPWATFAIPLLGHGLVAPNLFHFIARPLAIVIPFVMAFAIVIGTTKRRLWFAVGAGAALTLMVITPSLRTSVERGYVEEVYFERPNGMRDSIPVTAKISGSLIARAAAQQMLPPPSWPF